MHLRCKESVCLAKTSSAVTGKRTPAHTAPCSKESHAMLTLLLIIIIVCIAAGIIGFVVHGLLWLFVIACVVFVLSLIGSWMRHGRRSARPQR